MPKTDRLDDLREHAKAHRRKAKRLIKLINLLEGAEATLTRLEDDEDAEDVNVELAADGDILFDVDVGELPAVRESLVALCQTVRSAAADAIAEAEQELA